MRRKGKKTYIAILAVVLTLLASTGVTLAYFSDYETAMGEVTLHLNGETQITEEVTDTQKVIRVVNTGQAGDASVVVRVAVYGPDQMKVTAEDSHWQEKDGYYYYDRILAPGETTSALTADVTGIPTTADMAAFDIVVTHESAIAAYDENNQVKTPEGWDWIPVIKAQ